MIYPCLRSLPVYNFFIPVSTPSLHLYRCNIPVPSGFLSMSCGAMAIARERPQPRAALGCAPLSQEAPLQHHTARAHCGDVREGQDVSFWCALHSNHVPLQLWSCQGAVRRAGAVNEAYVSYWASKDLWVAAFSIWKLMYCKEWRQTGAGYFSAAGCPVGTAWWCSARRAVWPLPEAGTHRGVSHPQIGHTNLTASCLHLELGACGKLWTDRNYRLDTFILPPPCFLSHNGDRENGTRKRQLLLK